MSVCVPIRDMKDTSKFLGVVQGALSPVTVTRNGCEALVVMTPEMYDGLRLDVARARLYERLSVAERDVVSGACVDGDSLVQRLLERYGD